MENLVIVESPAKAKTIEKFLGTDFTVKSSYGHIRDLSKKNNGVDIANQFQPAYEVSEDKKDIVRQLKADVKKAKTVWLASDEDREGEAIAWHLAEELQLDQKTVQRIVFHEITKKAILDAIKNPRKINKDLVDAQQARRILDRLVGFELSPVLWKKIKPSLSAGRVQSVAVRLIVERERSISAFKSTFSYKVISKFVVKDKEGKDREFRAELAKNLKDEAEVLAFLEKCKTANYTITDVLTKPVTKSPAAPFTTSTLQQEASRKLGFSVAQTMSVAQRLYEDGKITYMRTDSMNLSDDALKAAKAEIIATYGQAYQQTRQYTTKAKGAQEAHEAIRPTYMDKHELDSGSQEAKLYDLIWKRTIASQMSNAELERTIATINISTTEEKFVATGEVIKFDGFLKVYIESTDNEDEEKGNEILPPLKVGDKPTSKGIMATQKFTRHSPRYTEAALVKKLEELGIGRPSTYAPTISTVQNRGYVVKESREGEKRDYQVIILKDKTITKDLKSENTGAEKNKLFPTDIGMVVNDFLVENFAQILDYNFTANVEQEFDEIAQGRLQWQTMMDKFYQPFHKIVETATGQSGRATGQRLLGIDPKSGKNVYVRIGKFGPLVQIGENAEDKTAEKPQFASLRKEQRMESITLEDAMELFKLPRNLGDYESQEVVVSVGRFGPYIRHDGKFTSLKKEDNPLTIELVRAIELIDEKRLVEANKIIQEFAKEPELKVLNGRFGAYISYKGENYKFPKDKDAKAVSLEDCLQIVESTTPSKSKAKKPTKTAAKTTTKTATKTTATTKKPAAKKTTTKTKKS